MSASNKEINKISDDLPDSEKNVQIRFGDIYPTYVVPVLSQEKHPILCKWGFNRFDGKGVMINARAETVIDKKSFRKSFLERRCLIPANGFYEWDTQKNKYYFKRADGKVLYLGGFYRNEDGENRFIILTKQSTPPVDKYHNRIPVIVGGDIKDLYLCDTDFARHFILTDNRIKLKCM
ncbi:MAG: SOS response-associated peptidase [Roseburia sp.]|nr:SOS response-associated peptidase [Roseburia sp.]